MGKLRWGLEGEPGVWGAFTAIEQREKGQRSVIFHSWGQVVCVEWSVEEGKWSQDGGGGGSQGFRYRVQGWRR